jgi:hypothetical protein
MKKIKITNEQLKLLSKVITEESNKDAMVKKLKTELSKYYEPSVGVQREGGEYFDKPMILNKVSGEMITDKAVLDYLSYKPEYKGLSEEFLKQVIRDWFGGNLKKSNELTRNVTM